MKRSFKIVYVLWVEIAFALLQVSCISVETSASFSPKGPQKRLVITRDGVWEKNVDISGWDITKDVVELGDYPIFTYYPWQGEDSIDYSLDHNHLWVNGKLVGINLGSGKPEDIANPAEILAISVGRIEDVERLETFPNLITAQLFLEESDNLGVLNTLPERVKLYVRCDEAALKHLSGFANLRGVDVVVSDASWPRLEYLKRFPDLHYLRVACLEDYPPLNLRFIGKLKKLRVLEIDAVVDYPSMRYLSLLDNIRVLRVCVSNSGNRGLFLISRLENLSELWISDIEDRICAHRVFNNPWFDGSPSAKGFNYLQRLPHLYCLRLINFDIDEDVAQALGNLSNLNELYLYETGIPDHGTVHLTKLAGLKKLDLFQVPVEDSDLLYMSRLSALKYLGLRETRISREGLKYLSSLHSLENLSLSLNTLRDELGVIYLKELNGLKALEIEHFLTDTLLLNIVSLTSLRKLDLRNSSVSKTVIDSLQKALPECKIMY